MVKTRHYAFVPGLDGPERVQINKAAVGVIGELTPAGPIIGGFDLRVYDGSLPDPHLACSNCAALFRTREGLDAHRSTE